MIEWFNNSKLSIYFSEAPCVAMRVILPTMKNYEKHAIKKYPFINKKDIGVKIKYSNKEYCFHIFRNYCWDGATIPRFLHRLIGSNTSPEFLIPSCVHDVLCEHKDYVNHDRQLSSEIFKCLLLTAGVSELKAKTMAFFVDNFQRFQKGWK